MASKGQYVCVQIDEHQLLTCMKFKIWGSSNRRKRWNNNDKIVFFVKNQVAAIAIVTKSEYVTLDSSVWSNPKYIYTIGIKFKNYVQISDRDTNLEKYLSPNKKDKGIGLFLLGSRSLTDSDAIDNINNYFHERRESEKLLTEKEIDDDRYKTFIERIDNIHNSTVKKIKQNLFENNMETSRIFNIFWVKIILNKHFDYWEYEEIFNYFNRSLSELQLSEKVTENIEKVIEELEFELKYGKENYSNLGFEKITAIKKIHENVMKILKKNILIEFDPGTKNHINLMTKIARSLSIDGETIINYSSSEGKLALSLYEKNKKIKSITLRSDSLLSREKILALIIMNELNKNKINFSYLISNELTKVNNQRYGTTIIDYYNNIISIKNDNNGNNPNEILNLLTKSEKFLGMFRTDFFASKSKESINLRKEFFRKFSDIKIFELDYTQDLIMSAKYSDNKSEKVILFPKSITNETIKISSNELLENFKFAGKSIDKNTFIKGDLLNMIFQDQEKYKQEKSNDFLNSKKIIENKSKKTLNRYTIKNIQQHEFFSILSAEQKNIVLYFFNYCEESNKYTVLFHYERFNEVLKNKRRKMPNYNVFVDTIKLLIEIGFLTQTINHEESVTHKIPIKLIEKNMNFKISIN
ncbi:hypothetical protein RCC94_15320 [Exiguobacterium acetylicum]|uniref:hypothetical protein n=1 Tax=Exiguobacterium acetylicum TaxID=41170 RepID=UPI0027E11071|nr:hypothetical protein [Exiguobacterium acetylicum]MDQ6468868.1 hypothetical protein [Exiguobacterium acetylicum]